MLTTQKSNHSRDGSTKNESVIPRANRMKTRSHRYPDDDNRKFVDTTRYDEDDEYLDVGYQLLKKIHINKFPEFMYIKKLFIDHNQLTELPGSSLIPLLEELTCSYNKLTSIPFYPRLVFLNVSNNSVTTLNHYNNSLIKYLDCSFNPNLYLTFNLQYCTQLYITDNNIKILNLEYIPRIELLDCSNNLIESLNDSMTLIEINIQNNKIKKLPKFPLLTNLFADNNQIEILPTYKHLINVNITYNKLKIISDQPSVKKIIANNNDVTTIGKFPCAELLDLSYNQLLKILLPNDIKYVSLQFNPLTELKFSENTYKNILELQVNFDIYSKTLETYHDYITHVTIQISGEILTIALSKLKIIFSDKILNKIYKYFNSTPYKHREQMFINLTLRLYCIVYKLDKNVLESSDSSTMIQGTTPFNKLFRIVKKIYYMSLIMVAYFNDYFQ